MFLGSSDEPSMFHVLANLKIAVKRNEFTITLPKKAVKRNEFTITLPNQVQIQADKDSFQTLPLRNKGEQITRLIVDAVLYNCFI